MGTKEERLSEEEERSCKRIEEELELYEANGEDALKEIAEMLSKDEFEIFMDEVEMLDDEEEGDELVDNDRIEEMARSYSEPQELSLDTSKPLKAIHVFSDEIDSTARSSSLKCNVPAGNEFKYRISIKNSLGQNLIPVFDSPVIVSGQGLNGNNSIYGQRLLWEETIDKVFDDAEMALIDFAENLSKEVNEYDFKIEEIDCTLNASRTILSVTVYPCKKGRGWEARTFCPDSKKVNALLQRI